MKATLRTVFAALAAAVITLGVAGGAANAKMPIQDVRCRNALEGSLRLLTKQVLISMENCHRLCMICVLDQNTDCSDIDQLPAIAVTKIKRAETNVVTQVHKHCVPPVSSPAELGFATCDYPCQSIAINNYTDVAQCKICLAEYDAQAAVEGTYGMHPPVQYGRTAALMCQVQIGRALKEFTMVKSRQHQLCQYKEDLGRIPSTDCMTADLSGRIAIARNHLRWRITRCYADALTKLTSCGATIAEEQLCVENWAEGVADCLFCDVYGH